MPADVDGRALSEWCREHLGALVAERVFTAGTSVRGVRSSSAGQSEAFLEAYQSARERAFSKAELQLCWAAGLWVLAFNAKKFHLDGFDVLGRAEAESRMRLAGI